MKYSTHVNYIYYAEFEQMVNSGQEREEAQTGPDATFKVISPMTYFLLPHLTSQGFYDIPKQCHQLRADHSKQESIEDIHIQTITFVSGPQRLIHIA